MSRPFTKAMKKDYTLLLPNMLPIHFSIIRSVLEKEGYKCILLDDTDSHIIDYGLKYVHNDMCYPALLVIGQLISAIEHKVVDPKKCAVCITQTGGGCRASNYYNLLIKALEKAGYPDIPVISLNLKGMNNNPGFTFTFHSLEKVYAAVLYGDLLMLLKNQVKPYECNKGETDKLTQKWVDYLSADFCSSNKVLGKKLKRNFYKIVDEYASIKTEKRKIIKVGIVGEIYMKYSALGNNDLETFLANEGCEVRLLPLMDFVLYGLENSQTDLRYYGMKWWYGTFMKFIGLPYVKRAEKLLIEAIASKPQFTPPGSIDETMEYASEFIDLGVKMGEGWLLTGEMIDLIRSGYNNIITTQPFGCLPNHIVAKGMIRPIKERYPDANIVPIDYDPSMTKVNQENRIKLMLSVARENLTKEGD